MKSVAGNLIVSEGEFLEIMLEYSANRYFFNALRLFDEQVAVSLSISGVMFIRSGETDTRIKFGDILRNKSEILNLSPMSLQGVTNIINMRNL